MNSWALGNAPRLTVTGRWWRMLSPRWRHEPLSGTGAARAGGRWNAPGMSALYLSEDHATAIAEYLQSLIRPGTLAPYDIGSEAILDLTDPDVRASIRVADTMLTLPWRRIRDIDRAEPDSWGLARAAVAAGYDGCQVPSVQNRGKNLVLWHWGESGAQVTLVDPKGDLQR